MGFDVNPRAGDSIGIELQDASISGAGLVRLGKPHIPGVTVMCASVQKQITSCRPAVLP